MRAPEPYTPATVATIRERADKGQSDTGLAHFLGWDVATVRKIAKRHGIEVFSSGMAEPHADTTAALTNGKPPEHVFRTKPALAAPPVRVTVEVPAGIIGPAVKPARWPEPQQHSDRRPVSQLCVISLTAMTTQEMADRVKAFATHGGFSMSAALRKLIAAGLDALQMPERKP